MGLNQKENSGRKAMRNMKKGELSVELVAKYIMVVIGISVGASIIFVVGQQFPSEESTESEIMKLVSNQDYPFCRRYEEFENISKRDFKIITYARYTQRCEEPFDMVTLDFTLSKSFLKDFMEEFKITSNDEPLLLFSEKCDKVPGFKGFIVEGNEKSKVIFNKSSRLSIRQFDESVGICKFEFEIRKKGERCGYDWMCAKDLNCNKPVYDLPIKYCCPEDLHWDGRVCR